MKKIVILSEKTWHLELFENCKRKLPDYDFILIDNKNKFNSKNLENIKPYKIFIPHWSYLIPKAIFSNYDCVLFHMTDLPYGRGGSPLQNLIKMGFSETKVTALLVVEKIDSGPIYLKKKLLLNGSAKEIFLRASKIIESMIIEIIKKKLKPKKQIGRPTYFKRRGPDQSEMKNFNNILEIYYHIRMLDCEGYPKAFIKINEFKLEFENALIENEQIITNVRITKG